MFRHQPMKLQRMMRRLTVLCVLEVFLMLPVLPTSSQAADIAPARITTANGMTVVVLEQHFLPIVEIHALVKAGAAQDPPDKAGLANLVASLLDEGTTTR